MQIKDNLKKYLHKPAVVSWLIAILVIGILGFKSGKYFWVEAQFILEILIVTLVTRSVGLDRVKLAFFLGMTVSMPIMVALYSLLKVAGFTMNTVFVSGFLVGPFEEILKILPVVLIAYVVYKKRRILLNPTDFLLLSSVTGIGFSLAEKALWRGVTFDLTYGPHLGGFYFFPDALGTVVRGSTLGYIGHGAATGMIGMALGFGLFLKIRQKRWWWCLPLGVFVWIALEHALLNGYFATHTKALLWLGGGHLTPWLFLVLLLGVLVFDLRNLIVLFNREPLIRIKFKGLIKTLFSLTTFNKLTHSLQMANALAWQGAVRQLWNKQTGGTDD